MQQFRELLKTKSEQEIKDYMDSFKPNEQNCDFYRIAVEELKTREQNQNQ